MILVGMQKDGIGNMSIGRLSTSHFILNCTFIKNFVYWFSIKSMTGIILLLSVDLDFKIHKC